MSGVGVAGRGQDTSRRGGEASGELIRCQHGEASGGEFDGEGHAAGRGEDRSDTRFVGCFELDARTRCRGTIGEEGSGIVFGERAELVHELPRDTDRST